MVQENVPVWYGVVNATAVSMFATRKKTKVLKVRVIFGRWEVHADPQVEIF